MIKNDRPLRYQKIADDLSRFLDGASSGEKLPPERKLAERFRCNVRTVRRAMLPFVQSGRIVKRTGSGTFVAAQEVCAPRHAANPERIGMLIHKQSDEYALRLMKAVYEAADADGTKLCTAVVDGFGRGADEAAALLLADGCAALLVPWLPFDHLSELAQFIGRSPLPVTVSTLIPGLERHCFESPDVFGKGLELGIRAACAYLRKAGAVRLALVCPDLPGDPVTSRMVAAYSDDAYRHGMDNLSAPVGAGAKEMDGLAKRWKRYQGELGVVAYDDIHAIRFMTAMHKLGLSAPEDYLILGHNDSPQAPYTDPPLTSMRGDYGHLGRAAVRCVRAMARGDAWQSDSVALNVIVERASTCLGGWRGAGQGALRRELKRLGTELVADPELSKLPVSQ